MGFVLVALAGCKPKSPPVAATKPAIDAPSYSQLASAHNARVAQLKTLYGNGVLQIHWADEHGHGHSDQGDMELWLNLPRKTALRVEKVGEVLLWLGSDDDQVWVYDHLGKEKVLSIGRHDQPLVDEQGRSVAVKPLALLDLMGLSPLPDSPSRTPVVQLDQKRSAWMIEAISPGSGQPMRIFLDRHTLLPSHVETLDEQGAVVLSSDLRRYESVKQKGMSPAAYPKMAQLIEITDARRTGNDSNSIMIAINEYSDGYIDKQPFDRVFDLKLLVQSFQPDRTEGQVPK